MWTDSGYDQVTWDGWTSSWKVGLFCKRTFRLPLQHGRDEYGCSQTLTEGYCGYSTFKDQKADNDWEQAGRQWSSKLPCFSGTVDTIKWYANTNTFHLHTCFPHFSYSFFLFVWKFTGHETIPPVVIHSRPGTRKKDGEPMSVPYHLQNNIRCVRNGEFYWEHGIKVLVSKNVLMEKDLMMPVEEFVVNNLPSKDYRKPMIMCLDAHGSQFEWEAMTHLVEKRSPPCSSPHIQA